MTARPTHALLELRDEVEFEGRHLAVRQRLRARVESFERPRCFRDVMVRGAFRSFVHDHLFDKTSAGTRMTDRIQFRAPLWPLSAPVEHLLLAPYLRRLIAARGQELKAEAERRARRETDAT